MPQTVIEKIAQRYLVEPQTEPVTAGDFVSLRPEHVMTHDNSAAVMGKFRAIGAGAVADPEQPIFAIDHDIQNSSEANLDKYRRIERFARDHGIRFYAPGTGISHQVMCERGHVRPGALVVGSDSHSNMYGALAALGTPVVRTDAAAIWATGEFWWQVPRTVRVELTGELPRGSAGKDVIVTLCGLYNSGEALNAAVEFGGPGVATLSMDERMSISNMTTEWGALVGWFPCDGVCCDWLEERRRALEREGASTFTAEDVERWRADPPRPDEGAGYAAVIELDLGRVTPHVSGPDSVQTMSSVAELADEPIRIDKAYLVSCVNSRLSDLREAAEVLRDRRVADGVELYVAAASSWVQRQAEEEGTWGALLDAGAIPLPSGCGPCIGLGRGTLEPGETGISATNRNFKGRMGSRDAKCYLASPAVVAASAMAGRIVAPEEIGGGRPEYVFRERPTASRRPGAGEIVDGFPETLRGRLAFVPVDNLNTDGIYAGSYTYREDMTPQMMSEVVMENHDPGFAERVRPGDLLVGGFNFGTGSSREQAATALAAAGIPAIVAGSFSQTYLRNAFNNGVPCVTAPELVARLRELYAVEIEKGERTVWAEHELELDFTAAEARFRGESFPISPMSRVAQRLVVAGGVENQIRARLD